MKKVHGSIKWSDKPMPDGWGSDGSAWEVQLRYEGRQMTLPFYTGSALGEPTIADVLECLLMDESYADSTFADFCSDLGYDEDSRRALATYKAVVKSAKSFRRLMGTRVLNLHDMDPDVWAKSLAAEEWSNA